MTDPTLQLLADLDDPAKFRRVERVSYFKPHTRRVRNADGTAAEIEVTAADLSQIAANINATYRQTGRPNQLTLGHIKHDPNYPEHLQPKLVGFAKDFKAEVVRRPAGTLLTVTATEYIRADQADEVLRQYPFRSPDYDPAAKTFGGIALLTRDPWLDTGAVYVYARHSNFVQYQAGTPMAEPTTDGTPTPEEEAQYAKVCAYMKAKFPRLAEYMDDPSGTNTAPPAVTPATPYQKPPEFTQLEADNLRLTVERELDQLAYQGVRFDRAVELPKLVGMKPEERATHVAYMKTHYGKTPTAAGGMIPVAGPEARPTPPADKNAPLRAAEVPKVLAYQKGGLAYTAAVAKVIGERQ